MTGRQRLQQIKTKVNLIAARQMRAFMAGELDILPCSGDLLEELICREFDKMGGEDGVRGGGAGA